MIGSCVFLCFFAALSAPPEVDAQAFDGLIRSLHSSIKDVSLVFECQNGTPNDLSKVTKTQGVYLYRQDGPTLLDVYVRHSDERISLMHDTLVLFGNQLEELKRSPDRRQTSPSKSTGGDFGSFNRPQSFQRLFFLPFFRLFGAGQSAADSGYEYEGWEDCDGRLCLKVLINLYPRVTQNKADRLSFRFWIDLERGGHPLRVDWVDRQGVYARNVIKLEMVRDKDGKTIWFPYRGFNYSYVTEEGYSSKPVEQEQYAIVEGSLRINDGIPDDRFRVNPKGGDLESPVLRPLKKQYDETPPFRTDPVGTRARLDTMLAQADAQAKELTASASSDIANYGPWILFVVASISGVLVVALVIRRAWRHE